MAKREGVLIPAAGFDEAQVRLRFRYLNWRGDDHEYVIDVESVEFGSYDKGGGTPRPREDWAWVVHGQVITRDGDARSDMGPTRRRTFMIDDIRELERLNEL